jgi:hypothetical protein
MGFAGPAGRFHQLTERRITMRTSIFAIAIFTMALLASPDRSGAQTRMGLDIRNGRVDNFYVAIGDYYRVPTREITVVHERGIVEDEIPVVYFIARHSGRDPQTIVAMRLRGDSWVDISNRCGVSTDAYYLNESGVSGPPFGNAYGHYKHGRGRRAGFSDNDIVTSVNVHWMKDRYGWSAPEVIKYRSSGESFASIHEKFRSRGDRDENDQGHGHGNGRGHGNGHGNGKHKGWK